MSFNTEGEFISAQPHETAKKIQRSFEHLVPGYEIQQIDSLRKPTENEWFLEFDSFHIMAKTEEGKIDHFYMKTMKAPYDELLKPKDDSTQEIQKSIDLESWMTRNSNSLAEDALIQKILKAIGMPALKVYGVETAIAHGRENTFYFSRSLITEYIHDHKKFDEILKNNFEPAIIDQFPKLMGQMQIPLMFFNVNDGSERNILCSPSKGFFKIDFRDGKTGRRPEIINALTLLTGAFNVYLKLNGINMKNNGSKAAELKVYTSFEDGFYQKVPELFNIFLNDFYKGYDEMAYAFQNEDAIRQTIFELLGNIEYLGTDDYKTELEYKLEKFNSLKYFGNLDRIAAKYREMFERCNQELPNSHPFF